jgi:hypothetical protein
MVRELPTFLQGRPLRKRISRSGRVTPGVWYDVRDDRFEYSPDPRGGSDNWHEIDWRNRRYRDIDPETGRPVTGSEGRWRLLR